MNINRKLETLMETPCPVRFEASDGSWIIEVQYFVSADRQQKEDIDNSWF
ncbi:hypothetical protein [Flocculibacter collagenilyticus]|nr:hypothetical protein [Flocculibacter collagenilyticus]